jgi:hypothetical protein
LEYIKQERGVFLIDIVYYLIYYRARLFATKKKLGLNKSWVHINILNFTFSPLKNFQLVFTLQFLAGADLHTVVQLHPLNS